MRGKAQELLNKGINVEFSGTMRDGFQISPEDGRFKVRFTSEDFENYFKTFARPRTYQLLFGEHK
jgi:V/A-type H+-transporting ATPase subunit E